MIIVFWITLAGILGAIGVAAVSIIKTLHRPRWGNVLTETMKRRELAIDAPGGPYKAFLYTSTDFEESQVMPGMIVLPDRGEKHPAFEHWASVFALQGLPTLAVELDAKKIPDQDLVEGLAQAIPAFKKVLIENVKIDGNCIGIFGFGLSAVAGVYAGANDVDVKIICCGGMPRVVPDRVGGAKGKVFLAHCKDDDFAPLADFTSNKETLGLGDKEYLLLELGGHKFISQEAVIAGYFSIPVNRVLKPRYKQFTPRGVVIP